MTEEKSEEVKARDARLRKIREQEGDRQITEESKKDDEKDAASKKT